MVVIQGCCLLWLVSSFESESIFSVLGDHTELRVVKLQTCMEGHYWMCIAVNAVTQACCHPVLKSSSEKWAMHFALNRAAWLWCWVTAHLYEEQISIAVNAETKACSDMHCSIGLGKMHCPLFSGALQNRLTAGTVSLQLQL